jgi:hypothetical protein
MTGLAFTFRLAKPTLTLNRLLRMRHWQRTKYARDLAIELRASYRTPPAQPLEKARLFIRRHAVQAPDYDGMVGGCKLLIDCLLVRSDRHPHGLGFIVDDSIDRLRLVVEHVQAPSQAEQCTEVEIWTI